MARQLLPEHPFRSLTATPLRVGGLAVAAVLASGLLAACSGTSGGNPATTSSASTPTPSTTTTTVAPSTPAPTTTVTDPASSSASNSGGGGNSGNGGGGSGGGGNTLANCKESQLRASLDPRPVDGSSDHGDLAVIVDFTNTSNSACTIYGYPGAALVDKNGKQVKQATRTIRGQLLGLPPSQNTLPKVTLQPGKVASAGIEGVNQQEQGAAQAGCDNASYPRILVTPPNTKTAVPFNHPWPVCYSFTVHPTNIEKNPPK